MSPWAGLARSDDQTVGVNPRGCTETFISRIGQHTHCAVGVDEPLRKLICSPIDERTDHRPGIVECHSTSDRDNIAITGGGEGPEILKNAT